MVCLLLTLTVTVLLAVTGAASVTHGLIADEVGHHAMESPEEGRSHAASVEECCDAVGAAGAGCLIDAALSAGRALHSMQVTTTELVSVTPVMSGGFATSVPTGPPKG